MVNLVLLSGIPGSGKSTQVNKQLKENPNRIWISRDVIRFRLLKDGEEYFSHEDEVVDIFIKSIDTALHSGCDVVYADATFLTENARNKILDKLNLEGVEITIADFNVSLKTCLERNEQRNGRACVPRDQIRRMFFQKRPATYNEKHTYKEIIRIEE